VLSLSNSYKIFEQPIYKIILSDLTRLFEIYARLYLTFSIGFIYEAYDKQLQKNVALKVEKKDKNKNILIFEYNVLLHLKGKSVV